MKVLADSRITHAAAAFSQFGEVTLFEMPLDVELTRDVDILLTRSDLKIDGDLLRLCRPTFVGCPTVGTDHVDFDYLRDQGIAFAHAPGCNSDAVRDYVVAALLELATRRECSLKGRSLGVVGVGRIGRRVARAATALGMEVLLNDPPRDRSEPAFHSLPLDELLEADFVTLHVPLTSRGPDSTHHLFNRSRLSRLKSGSVLINASRGAVVDGRALKRELQEGRLEAFLDVWENEPDIDWDLLELVQIGTPHLAGQTIEARERGARVLLEACCRHLGVESSWASPGTSRPSRTIRLQEGASRPGEQLLAVVREACHIEADARSLRELLELPVGQRAGRFHELRRSYRRHEFSTFSVGLPVVTPLVQTLRALGFCVSQGGHAGPEERPADSFQGSALEDEP